MTSTIEAWCSGCGEPLPAGEDPPSPCPKCESVGRTIRLGLMDKVEVYDGCRRQSVSVVI
jgi:Zn finger protein HypA/HybF involved in hydrogenase expression